MSGRISGWGCTFCNARFGSRAIRNVHMAICALKPKPKNK